MTPRTLPIRVTPIPGEALDSWLETVAARLDMPLRTLIEPLGLARVRAAGNKKIKPPNWTICLQQQEAEQLAAVTGIDATILHTMTLQPFNGDAIELDLSRRAIRAGMLWGRRGSRFCPDCLADNDGRWQIRWRLGWYYACLTHTRLLADACAHCERVPRVLMPSITLVPAPGRCSQPRLGSTMGLFTPRCDHPLTATPTTPLPPQSPIIATQQLIDKLVSDPAACQELLPVYSGQITTRQALIDLKAIAAKVIAHATDTELEPFASAELITKLRTYVTTHARRSSQPRLGYAGPRSAAAAAIALTTAFHMLQGDDIATVEQRTGWLTTRAATQRALTPGTSDDWGRHISPTLKAIIAAPTVRRLPASGRLTHRATKTGLALPASGQAAARRARHLPSALWPWWALRLSPPATPRPRAARQALSACLLRVGARITHAEAMRLLQPSTANEHAIRYLLSILDHTPHGEHVITALTRLADTLDTHGSPIDYIRRRTVFGTRQHFLTAGQWRHLTADHPSDYHSFIHAQRWLFETLTGCMAEAASGILTLTSADLPSYQDFRARLWPNQTQTLHDIASELLAQHDINEPVTWQPQLPELTHDVHLPGPDPDSVSPSQVQQLVLAENAFPQQIAERLGTTAEHIRYLHDLHPINLRHSQADINPCRSQAEQWKTWYIDHGWTLDKIRDHARVDTKTIRQTLINSGVTIRPPRFRHLHLAEELIRRRQAGERLALIAKDLGIPIETAKRMLNRNGITQRDPRGLPPRLAYHLPEIIRRYSVEMQSLKAIARALGISDRTVTRMLDRAGISRRDHSTQRASGERPEN